MAGLFETCHVREAEEGSETNDCALSAHRRLADQLIYVCSEPDARVSPYHDAAVSPAVHFHTIALDGVYTTGADGRPVFHRLPAPDDAEVERIAERVARRIAACLAREADAADEDGLAEREPWLAALAAASVRGRTATGQGLLRLGDEVDPEALAAAGERRVPLCADVAGVGLHAGVAVPAHDRERLERLLRYAARPPLCNERLSSLEEGRLLYRLKRRWRDGTTHVVFEPLRSVEEWWSHSCRGGASRPRTRALGAAQAHCPGDRIGDTR